MFKISLLIFFLFILSKNMPCQNDVKTDTVLLLKTWEKTRLLLEEKDTIKLREVLLDSIHCELCGFRNDTVVDLDKPISYFFKNGLNTLTSYKRLWTKIRKDKPELFITVFFKGNEKRYSILYTTYLKGELGPKHGGCAAVFEYVLRDGGLKLFYISTIP
jgi:hypothetical protein